MGVAQGAEMEVDLEVGLVFVPEGEDLVDQEVRLHMVEILEGDSVEGQGVVLGATLVEGPVDLEDLEDFLVMEVATVEANRVLEVNPMTFPHMVESSKQIYTDD